MTTNEYLVVALLAVLVLYGLIHNISVPFIVRKFYRLNGFVGHGKSSLRAPTDSVILEPLATSSLYRGQFKNYAIDHCKAYPNTRRVLTFSRVKRKYNQSRWSVTILKSPKPLPSFVLLPTSEPATAFHMLSEVGIDIEDPELKNRYYLRTDNEETVKSMICGDIKEFLLEKELISIESVNDTVIIKRQWPDTKIQPRLTAEMDCVVAIADHLSPEQ